MTDSLHIYLTSSTIFVRKKTRFFLKSKLENVGEWSWKGHIPEALPWEMILPTAQSKKTPFVHIYLGGGMCKMMVFDLPENLNDFAETIAEAKTQMIQKLGINQTEWQFTIRYKPCKPESNYLCCANATNGSYSKTCSNLSKESHFSLTIYQWHLEFIDDKSTYE